MRFLVHRRPGTALRFALRYAPAFITLFDVFGLTFSCRWGFADGARPINADQPWNGG